jgi:aminoglycoside phosphotransferase (APT) family kinase protein
MLNDSHLEFAARKSLRKYIGKEEPLTAIYLQPDRAVFLAKASDVILKVYLEGDTLKREFEVAEKAKTVSVPIPEMIGLDIDEYTVLVMKQVIGMPLNTRSKNAIQDAGKYLRKFHGIGAKPPFSGGQNKWDEFVLWWAFKEIDSLYTFEICSQRESDVLKTRFKTLQPTLQDRPIALLHGDLQAEHILVDEEVDKVIAFLDFADAQPGDPLMDIAVLTLWNHELTDSFLEGYESIENTTETQNLITHYRLLRHIAEVPWLHKRGLKDLEERNISAVKKFLDS